jgi:hypothetical protein
MWKEIDSWWFWDEEEEEKTTFALLRTGQIGRGRSQIIY